VGDLLHFPKHAPKLRALSERERDSKAIHRHDLLMRNRAIVEAVEDGDPQNQVAKVCGLKPSSITRILGLPASALELYEGDDAA